jgi:hypothetical protein
VPLAPTVVDATEARVCPRLVTQRAHPARSCCRVSDSQSQRCLACASSVPVTLYAVLTARAEVMQVYNQVIMGASRAERRHSVVLPAPMVVDRKPSTPQVQSCCRQCP